MFFIAFPSVSIAEKYLCVADQASGFHFDGKSWGHASFKTDGKYMIAQSKRSTTEKPKIAISLIGGHEMYFCDGLLSSQDELYCGGLEGRFRFDPKTNRFLKSYTAGYINGDQGKDTPHIEIGRCSSIESS